MTVSGVGGPLAGLERVSVAGGETAQRLYDLVTAATGLPSALQRLWWGGRELERAEPLLSYGPPSADWETVTLLVDEPPPVLDDRAILTVLYHSCGGATWENSENWLSEEPLSSWYGVKEVNEEGRVTKLNLCCNNLEGLSLFALNLSPFQCILFLRAASSGSGQPPSFD